VVSAAPTDARFDFDRDLERMDRDLAELEEKARTGPPDLDVAIRIAGRRYHRAALTGRPADAGLAEEAVGAALRAFPGAPDLCLIRANLDFMLHRLPEVRQTLQDSPALAESTQGRAIRGDLFMQEGRYADARREFSDVMAEDPTWDNIARLAHFEAKFGAPEEADSLYEQAEDELTAKQMRAYAWVELQRGLLDRAHGRYDGALEHYRRADAAYSGYWLVREHMAEVLGAQRRWSEAAAAYEAVVRAVPRPELYQALAELYLRMGDAARAEPWKQRALDGYLASVRSGGVHYFHHLVDFYADVMEDGPAAVEWASRDIALRRNAHTQAALAWALYRAGRFDEAARETEEVLKSGLRDAHSLAQAATILAAAGAGDRARHLSQAANDMNPHLDAFHVHR
jgi:tetratricopeptide (TPR) repeat protein